MGGSLQSSAYMRPELLYLNTRKPYDITKNAAFRYACAFHTDSNPGQINKSKFFPPVPLTTCVINVKLCKIPCATAIPCTATQKEMIMDYIEATKNDLKVEKELIELYEDLLKSLPEGRLVTKLVYGRRYYYRIMPGTQKQVYISVRNLHLIQALKKRKYMETALKILKENVKVQERLIKKYAPYGDKDILSKIGKGYQPETANADNVPIYKSRYRQSSYDSQHSRADGNREHYQNHLSGDAPHDSRDNWIGGTIGQSSLDFKADALIHRTSFGLMVRSKSEAIISEFLNKNGIKFAYEEPLYLHDADGRTTVRYPDFTLYLANGRIIYWEHLGMLKDESYRKAVWKKFALYYSNDIVPGSNLIITCDSSTGGIDIAAILQIIGSLK